MLTVAQILDQHVTLDVECIDRLYLNGYVPWLQTAKGLTSFLGRHRGNPVASPALLGHMTRDFNAALLVPSRCWILDARCWSKQLSSIQHPVPCIQHRPPQAAKARKVGPFEFDYRRADVYVKHYYFYIDDASFGPAFIKVCTYAPFSVRVCLNGHEWAKRQASRCWILDARCWSKQLSSIQHPVPCIQHRPPHGGLERLPFPLTSADRAAGYQHRLSIWQLEFSRTQVFERPLRGRQFFESVIRENIDLGRPERVQLLFDRQIRKTTPGRFSTRVITSGVHPSIHIGYKRTDIKQYFKLNRALRTETTIKNARDFDVGKDIRNLGHLRDIARNTNRRLLEVQRVSQDCVIYAEGVERLTQPTVTDDGQRAPSLRLGDPRVMALFAALILFLHLPNGFRNRELRVHVADLLGDDPNDYTTSKMSYDLRRLRLKGIIARVPGTTRYFLTHYGYRVSLFVTRLNARILQPGFACSDPFPRADLPHSLRRAFDRVETEIDDIIDRASLKSAA